MASLSTRSDSTNDQDSSYNLEEDAQECVLSLLLLKHPNRSVTPEQNPNAESECEANTVKPVLTTPLPSPLPMQPQMLDNDAKPVPLLPEQPIQRPTPVSAFAQPLNKPAASCEPQPTVSVPPVPILPFHWKEQVTVGGKVPPLLEEFPELTFENVLGDSPLVTLEDRGLVPDSLWVALAQMKPCRLAVPDRFGPYKNREIGFVGMCCKHCGGSPGFGRFFPASQRSAAQTTTSQTMTKHMDSKCRFVPPHIRRAINELQRVQHEKEATIGTGRPRYGARKVFFERVWARLHDPQNLPPPLPIEDTVESEAPPPPTVEQATTAFEFYQALQLSAVQDELGKDASMGKVLTVLSQRWNSLEDSFKQPYKQLEQEKKEKEEPANKKSKKQYRFGMLPTKKSVKRRMMGLDVGAKRKRARMST